MNAIIFLAPISCFDQVLQEDPSVNRLVRLISSPLTLTHSLWQADSFLLWKAIVSNPLLKKTELILFLNKCDILRAKLSSGIRLADYIVSYGSRPNDFESASQCKSCPLLSTHSLTCRLIRPEEEIRWLAKRAFSRATILFPSYISDCKIFRNCP